MYLLNISGETWPEPVEGRWFRQAQPTAPRFIEKTQDGDEIPLPRGLEANLDALQESEGEEYFLTYGPTPFVLA